MIEIAEYKKSWPTEFTSFAMQLKDVIGDDVLAIHHIGSTSVPDLAAKDIIDMQITVRNFELGFKSDLEALGLEFREDINRDHMPAGMELEPTQLEKRYFKNHQRPMNIHVRVQDRWNQRYPLLCRDYLRSHPMAANAYEEIKKQLARYFPNDVDAYYDIKDPVFDVIMSGAFDWAELTHWQVPDSDI